jgi:DNA invertase Pin-like site-specific DNA recombinase
MILRGMEMCNYYFYMRISTKEANDKQSFNRQEKSLKAYAESNNIKFTDRYIYKDDITGSTFDRTEWKELEGNLKEGDTVVFKEISRFTRQAEEGYEKYMELMNKGVSLVFIDNPTVSTDYIKNLTRVAYEQNLVAKTALESTIKLLLIVELDRVQQEREIIVKRIKQGIEASDKKSGRKVGNLDKMSEELRADIKEFLSNRSIKQVELMNKHNISRNTLKKYVGIVKNEVD